MIGFVEAEPANRNDMFMNAPKKVAIPVRCAEDQAEADRKAPRT